METSRRRRKRGPGVSRVTTFRPITLSAVKERNEKNAETKIKNSESTIENAFPNLPAQDNHGISSDHPPSRISKVPSYSSSEEEFVPDDDYFAGGVENSKTIMLPTPVVFSKKASRKRQSLVGETPLNRKSSEFQVEPYQNKILENTNSSKKRKTVQFSVPRKPKQDTENNQGAGNFTGGAQKISRKNFSPYLVKYKPEGRQASVDTRKQGGREKRNPEQTRLEKQDISDILGLHDVIQVTKRNQSDLNVILTLLKQIIKDKCAKLRSLGKRDWKKESNNYVQKVEAEFEKYENIAEAFYVEDRKNLHIRTFTKNCRDHVMELQQENRMNEATVLEQEKELETKLRTDQDDFEANMYINSIRDVLNRL